MWERLLSVLRNTCWLIIFGIALLANSAHAQGMDKIVLLDHLPKVDTKKGALVFEDTTKNLSIGQVIQADQFTSLKQDRFFLKYKSNSVLWVKLRLHNASSQRIFLIDVPNATIDDLRFYAMNPEGKGFKMQQVGDAFPHHHRIVSSLGFTFQANIPTGEYRDYYLRIDSRGDAISTDIDIWQPVAYLNETANTKYVFGLYYGVLLFIVIFHLFLYIRMYDKSLVYYMLYIVAFAGAQMTLDGFTASYFLPDFPWLVNRLLPAFIYLATWGLIGFFQHFQNTKEKIPKLNKFLVLFKYMGVLLAFGCLLNHEIFLSLLQFAGIYALVSLLIVLACAVYMLRIEPVLSRYFISAFIFLALGIVMGLLRPWGIHIPGSEYGMKLGAATEIIVLAFALAEKFKLIEEEANQKAVKSLEDLNEFQKRYNQDLKEEVEHKTAVLEKSNQNIRDSIKYAQRIQSSLLPREELLEKSMDDYFIYYQPRDVVSGDFYWFGQCGKHIIIAVVDCTGHGVPGAFMSILGINALHEIVTVRKLSKPSYILMAMNEYIRESLRQNNTDSLTSDGMDAAVISFDMIDKEIQFAGAKRPLVYFKDGQMNVVKGSKYAIGGKTIKEKVFNNVVLKASEVDQAYLFTDGYVDQFGGPSDRKYMIRRFKALLSEVQGCPMMDQREVIDKSHKDWKGQQRQIDDILVIGLNFKKSMELESL